MVEILAGSAVKLVRPISDEDPADMANRVEFLLRNPEVRQAFGAASRQIAETAFNMDLMVERYLAILEPAEAEHPTA